ncbi:MAG: serine/threonine protein kinase [Tildeniella nuda ZEHNDER 1965/U140]|nr:serine/threonine protein kinase [Tildeniella nuda ZEHNDER 1965/U140]
MSDVLTQTVSYSGLDRLLDGRYQVIQILATGNWGRTYLAQDTRRPSQPECAIQHVVPVAHALSDQSALRQLFVREASTLERLGEHEQIPQLLACFEDEQGFHLVQEFVSGTSLSLELMPQPWDETRVVQLLVDCLKILAVVHEECCRHGDIQPDNLIRRSHDGKLMLTNFGTVRDIHLSLMTLQGQAAASMVPDTHGYQPPEQVQGLPCLASDIYAVGMIGIQALTGVKPLQLGYDTRTWEILWQPFGQTAGSTLRHGLVAVLSRMVRTDHTQRYPSAKEALQALQQLTQAVPHKLVEETIAPALTPNLSPQEPSQALALLNLPHQEASSEPRLSTAVQIGVGIGAVVAAAVCGYALPHLLDRTLFGTGDPDQKALAEATQQYQAGQLQKAVSLAETIPKDSAAYAPAREAIAHWQTDWQTAEQKSQAAKAAFQQGNGLVVLQQAQGLPQNSYWQAQVKPLVEQSMNQAEAAAAQLLRDAYGRAIVKDFAGAIVALKQIPEGTSVYAKAQEKLREYSEKQQVQAVSYLQIAYDQAETKAFDKALETLQKISADTPTHATAQTKTREYTEKQRIRAEALALQDLNPGSYLQEANLARQ